MKIPVGIVGYGNLGKAVEKRLQNSDDFELKAIFSKRDLPNAEKFETIIDFKDKIDFLFVCGGSQNELENQTLDLIKNFDLIDSYDNHNRLKEYFSLINQSAKDNKKIALCSFGWDPGIFSLFRGICAGLGFTPYTFWGKGLSQGHTQAIKSIPNVIDAIQFTVPNEEIIKSIKNGKEEKQGKHFHKRECFVVADDKYQEKITNQIVNMKDYFEGYQTEVNFLSQQKLNELKSFRHKGTVLTQSNIINFSIDMQSNPDFTANILVSFAKCFTWLKSQNLYGAYSIFDLPLKALVENKFDYL